MPAHKIVFDRQIAGTKVRLLQFSGRYHVEATNAMDGRSVTAHSTHSDEFGALQKLLTWFPEEEVRSALSDLYDDEHMVGGPDTYDDDEILSWLEKHGAPDALKGKRKQELSYPEILRAYAREVVQESEFQQREIADALGMTTGAFHNRLTHSGNVAKLWEIVDAVDKLSTEG